MAVGIRVIYEPLGLVTGGVSGFAIVVESWTSALFSGGIPVWISTAIINIPLFIAGIFVKGKGYIIRSFFAVIIFTLELGLIPQMDVAGEDPSYGGGLRRCIKRRGTWNCYDYNVFNRRN